MATESQLKAISNTQLASNAQIPATKHRAVNDAIIEELFNAQSRADVLSDVQVAGALAGGDRVLVIRSGQGYLLNADDFGFIDKLVDLTDVNITSPLNNQVVAWDDVTSRFVAKSIDNIPQGGTVNLVGNQTVSGIKTFASAIVQSVAAQNPNELTRLDQVEDLLSGISWRDPVINFVDFTTAEPATPTSGDRYINTVTGSGSITTGQTFTINRIYEWNGSAWIENTPLQGWTVVNNDDSIPYNYNGTAWVAISTGTLPANVALTDEDNDFSVGQTIGGDTTINGHFQVSGLIEFNSTTLNTLLGSGAGANMATTGSLRNLAVGYQALFANTTGDQNTAVGYRALFDNITGEDNTANGYQALRANTTGFRNTANGWEALRFNTTGDYNTANGYIALYDNTTGENNTALGYNTGRGITTGSANTIIGANVTGLPAALSNTVIITDGDGNQRIRVDSSGNVLINQTTGTEKLDVNGNVKATSVIDQDGTLGKKRVTLGSNPSALDAEDYGMVIGTATYTASTTLTFSNVTNLDELALQITNTNANVITFAGVTLYFKSDDLPSGVSFAANALTFPADSAVKYNIAGVKFDGSTFDCKIEIR